MKKVKRFLKDVYFIATNDAILSVVGFIVSIVVLVVSVIMLKNRL